MPSFFSCFHQVELDIDSFTFANSKVHSFIFFCIAYSNRQKWKKKNLLPAFLFLDEVFSFGIIFAIAFKGLTRLSAALQARFSRIKWFKYININYTMSAEIFFLAKSATIFKPKRKTRSSVLPPNSFHKKIDQYLPVDDPVFGRKDTVATNRTLFINYLLVGV